MTATTNQTTTNPYQRFLIWAGGVLLALGVVIFVMAQQAAERAENVAQLGATLVGGYYDPSEVFAANAWMLLGIAFAVIGVIMLIIVIAIRAAKSVKPG